MDDSPITTATRKKQNRPNMKQVYFTDQATEIVRKMPDGEASQMISLAVVAQFGSTARERVIAKVKLALLELEQEE